jgi:hypothetical protein
MRAPNGANSIDVVPVDRQEPAEICAEIYRVTAADFISATHRVYSSSKLPSHIVLPLVP